MAKKTRERVAIREENLGQTSYFYSIYWDAEQGQPVEDGWNYYPPRITASAKTLALYVDWKNRQARKKRIAEAWERWKHVRQLARIEGVSFSRAHDAVYIIAQGNKQFSAFMKIARLVVDYLQGAEQSEFRQSLARQVIEWLQGKSKHEYPLSPKQMRYV